MPCGKSHDLQSRTVLRVIARLLLHLLDIPGRDLSDVVSLLDVLDSFPVVESATELLNLKLIALR